MSYICDYCGVAGHQTDDCEEMEQEMLAEIQAEHPGETWMQACGSKSCRWGEGEAWVPNERIRE